MKLALSVAVAACGAEDGEAGEAPVLVATPAVTEVAAPTGAPVSRTIGAAGGSLSSADGRLTIDVPEGALAADTDVRITPIGNAAPGSVVSYRLEPEGVTFASPVSLRFVVTDAELQGSTPEALRIATQTPERTWRVLADAVLAGDALSATTTHFSDYSLLLGWQIRPGTASVKAGKSLPLTTRYCALVDAGEELAPVAAACQDNKDLAPFLMNPSVNGVRGGSAAAGTVTLDESTLTFTAPSKVPAANPVAVSVEVGDGTARVTLVSNVRVTDGGSPYRGTVTFSTQNNGNFTIEGRADVVWESKREAPEQSDYEPSGSLHVVYTQTSPRCDPYEGTFPIEKGGLTVFPPDAPMFANGYTFHLEATPDVSLNCVGADDKPFTVSLPLRIYMQAGVCDGATAAPYTDANVLVGEGTCAPLGITSSSWELRRAE